ncbi:MAG: hypothetical protein CMJ18_10950, partial [Phycisphaeraceae bacterium]|nr:hypothetical protein [Phycisphaeraceae bacterium]
MVAAVMMPISIPSGASAGMAITTIDFPGGVDTFAGGINDFEEIVGQYRDGGGAYHGFYYSGPGGTFSTLDVPGQLASPTTASEINNLASDINNFSEVSGRHGRDRPFGRPPAQIPACGTTALGSYLGY